MNATEASGNFTVEINNEWSVNPELLVMGLFGCSMEQLINNIRANKNGEYNYLYE